MLDENNDPYVLEFNTRFGDPETQALMLRLKSDTVDLFSLAAKKRLRESPPLKWSENASLYVVATAPGYPGSYLQGDAISGIENAFKKR